MFRSIIVFFTIFTLIPLSADAAGVFSPAIGINTDAGVSESFLGVFWDNDIFFKTDYYYTNGVGIEWQSDLLRLKFLEFDRLSSSVPATTRYRLSLSQKMFTPVNITSYGMSETDRPYAGTMVLQYSRDRFTHRQKSTVSLGMGSIGAPSGSEQTQRIIHQSLRNDTAVGWSHQVNTDLLLNLYLSKNYLLVNNKYLDLSGGYQISLGTLESNTSGNLKLRVGQRKYLFDNSGILQSRHQKNSVQYYLYFSYAAKLVFHDASLHGGIINTSENRHTIGYGKTYPLVHHAAAGFVVGIKNFNFVLKAEQLSPEFIGGLGHRYGSIQICYYF